MSYCKAVLNMQPETRRSLHQRYHDNHYGFPLLDDNELFGRLVMEINQAGLSWETILRKEAAFREAYDGFDVTAVANYTDADRERLLNNSGIIRNRLKINAAIENAKTIVALQREFGSFAAWLDHQHPKPLAEGVKLFKKTFRFTGGEIVNEFLMSTGYLPGAHSPDCPVYAAVLKARPKWVESLAGG